MPPSVMEEPPQPSPSHPRPRPPHADLLKFRDLTRRHFPLDHPQRERLRDQFPKILKILERVQPR